jgi:hypothetical protein
MIERSQLLVDTVTVSYPVPVDGLPPLTHRPYNNLVLVAPGRWSPERALQPAKFELVTL